jgi:hypothetical protein
MEMQRISCLKDWGKFQGILENLVRPYLKIKFKKGFWCTSVAQCLPSMHEALSLIGIAKK